MYNIADKMITGSKFDFAVFAILALQIPIACFDMNKEMRLQTQAILILPVNFARNKRYKSLNIFTYTYKASRL